MGMDTKKYDVFIQTGTSVPSYARNLIEELGKSSTSLPLAKLRVYKPNITIGLDAYKKKEILEALENSKFLLVIGSPDDGNPKWVKEVIDNFLKDKANGVRLLITESWFYHLEKDFPEKYNIGQRAFVFSGDLSGNFPDPDFIASIIHGISEEELVTARKRAKRREPLFIIGFVLIILGMLAYFVVPSDEYVSELPEPEPEPGIEHLLDSLLLSELSL